MCGIKLYNANSCVGCWYKRKKKYSIFFGALVGEIIKKNRVPGGYAGPMKNVSDQSMVQADIVFPQSMCRYVYLWNGSFELSIDTMTTFSIAEPPL